MTFTLAIAIGTGSGLALAAAAHCALMCGPVALVARMRGGAGASAQYFVGRLASYTALGALAGSVGRALLSSPWTRWVEALLAWLLAASLLYAGLAALRVRPSERLVALGKGPRRAGISGVLARVAGDPLLLGAATALLPCGVLFTAVTAAAALGSAWAGALAMSAFACVSGLSVLGVAQLGGLRQRGPGLRRALGCALLLGAAITAYRPLSLLRARAGAPACHGSVEADAPRGEAP